MLVTLDFSLSTDADGRDIRVERDDHEWSHTVRVGSVLDVLDLSNLYPSQDISLSAPPPAHVGNVFLESFLAKRGQILFISRWWQAL